MGAVESRLEAAGWQVPHVAAPVATYVPAVHADRFVYTSGQLPLIEGSLMGAGKVGSQVAPAEAAAMAAQCALNALAAIRDVIGDLDRVVRVVKVTGYVSSDPGFTGQPAVVNGASEVLGIAFGADGAHARSAVGVAVLPLDAPVEVDVIVQVA